MKVLYCITRSDTLGGAHVHVADMARWMRLQGHEAVVAAGGSGAPGPYCRYLESRGIPHIRCRFLFRPIRPVNDLLACRELRNVIRQQSPDLVSLHSTKAGLIGRFSRVGRNEPVIFTAHGWSFTEGVPTSRARLGKILEKIAAPLADRFIAVSEYDRGLAVKSGICPEQKITVIHNGMPDTSHTADPGQRDGPARIIMVARLDSQKDHPTLLSALAGIKDRNWQLDLAGDGPALNALQKLTGSLGIRERVNFLGLRSDVEILLAKSHLFVLSSNYEGFPRSILEAMRAGLPVIASSVGGNCESVQQKETGFLVPRKNAGILSRRIRELIESPEERARMGERGRRRFEENFRFEPMAEKTLKLYRELAG